jgi:CDP-diacylglycerol--serine O-phosphatidyltransferase
MKIFLILPPFFHKTEYFRMKNIPNFITSLNLATGFIAIIYASNGYIVTASWLILAAMLFDFLDGFSARMLKAYSETGKELDSLADVISFGVAPALILYQLLRDSYLLYSPDASDQISLPVLTMLLVPAIMPVFSALRLARFNTDPSQATTFKGLPMPANALGVVSIVIAAHYTQSSVLNYILITPYLLVALTLILSVLMISRIPLMSMKVTSLKPKGNEARYILAGLVLMAFIIFGISAAPLIIPIYIIASLIALFF